MTAAASALAPSSPNRRPIIPSYISDLDDTLATWFQATNDGTGWKLEKKPRPAVGDYQHSEFRKQIAVGNGNVEAQICAILAGRDLQAKTAVCRLARNGSTLDGWRHRTIDHPVTASPRSLGKSPLPRKAVGQG